MGIMFRKSGLLTTIQDSGRRGYQRYGMGVSGAVDIHALICANTLVGNHHNEAALEATLIGPVIEFTSGSVIAVTGGDLSPVLNGKPLPMYRAVQVKKDDVLSFGAVKSGCRAYIAFAGGLAISPVMGSRSTYIKANLGGYEGRRLLEGDEIAFRKPASRPVNLEKRAIQPSVFSGDYTVRVLLGPQDDSFTEKGIQTFLSETYTVTNQFDRMGCRLSGPKIEHVTDGNIITDGIAFGAIQVPDGGEPIIMLVDRQTTGGYAKIASVINVDMSMIAQCKAGDTIRFVQTDIETAQDLYVAQKKAYEDLWESFEHPQIPTPTAAVAPAVARSAAVASSAPGNGTRLFHVTVNGKTYEVEAEWIKG